MGSTHFQMRRLENVRTEIGLHILAYNLKRVMAILGAKPHYHRNADPGDGRGSGSSAVARRIASEFLHSLSPQKK
jgi:hypothetical protein